MERLFISANYYKGNHKIDFLCVRYGNVLGSRGSFTPTILNQIITNKKITITDPNMTRFNITMTEALDLILRALKNGMGGEVFIPKLKAYKVEDMKNAIIDLMNSNIETEKIPVRPGEKYHESLISENEIRNTFENETDYVIFEQQTQNHKIIGKNGLKPTELTDRYSSDKVELLSKEELKKILIQEKLIPNT